MMRSVGVRSRDRAANGVTFTGTNGLPPVWIVIAAGCAAATWAVLQIVNSPVTVKAVAAAAAASAPLILAEARERSKRSDTRTRVVATHLRLVDRDVVPLVGEVDDPVKLGATKSSIAEEASREAIPPYVPRDVDGQLDAALASDRFVLLVGDSKAGKSRCGFEAIRRNLLDRRLVIPDRRESLPALLEAGFNFESSVVWLDDVENYVGAGGLSDNVLNRVIGPDESGTVVFGTIRRVAFNDYAPAKDRKSAEWELLRRARIVRLERRLTDEERRQTHMIYGNASIDTALAHYGLGEYLAAGPDLVERFEGAATLEPLGHAVVRAAMDWRRAGGPRAAP